MTRVAADLYSPGSTDVFYENPRNWAGWTASGGATFNLEFDDTDRLLGLRVTAVTAGFAFLGNSGPFAVDPGVATVEEVDMRVYAAPSFVHVGATDAAGNNGYNDFQAATVQRHTGRANVGDTISDYGAGGNRMNAIYLWGNVAGNYDFILYSVKLRKATT